MKKMKFQVAALSMLLVLGSCQTKTGTGAAIGAGSGAALGAIVGGLLNNSHRGTGALHHRQGRFQPRQRGFLHRAQVAGRPLQPDSHQGKRPVADHRHAADRHPDGSRRNRRRSGEEVNEKQRTEMFAASLFLNHKYQFP